MGERTAILEEMATTSTAVATVSPQAEEQAEPVVITLKAARTRDRKKVVWTDDTVDNEDMNKKKSKCCCIYEKPRKFDESSSESSDDECDHCFGHVEKKHTKKQHQPATTQVQDTEAEPITTVTLQPSEPAPKVPSPPDLDTSS